MTRREQSASASPHRAVLAGLAAVAVALAFWVRFGWNVPDRFGAMFAWSLPLAAVAGGIASAPGWKPRRLMSSPLARGAWDASMTVVVLLAALTVFQSVIPGDDIYPPSSVTLMFAGFAFGLFAYAHQRHPRRRAGGRQHGPP